jgi:pSer/pThr/pTyr-binding forkhead associated (FHA) protein
MSSVLLLVIRIAMAAALYAFLGWAIYILWRDIKRQSELIAARQIPELMIAFKSGEELISQRFQVPELVVGREQICDLILDEKTVSAEHARLAYHHGNWWVMDLDSRNGTYLNNELLSTQVVLTSGDEIQLGQSMLRVEIAGKDEDKFGDQPG